MRLNEDLIERVEEFFDLIPNDSGDTDLDFAIDRLRCLLEEDNYEDDLAFKILCRMEDLWDLVPKTYRDDSDLQEYYEDIMRDLESITASNSGGNCFGDDEEEFDGDDMDVAYLEDQYDEEEESWD